MTTRDELLQRFSDDSEDARRTRELIEQLLREHEVERQHLLALFDEAPAFMTYFEGPELRIAKVNRRIRDYTSVPLVGTTARELLEKDPRTLAIMETVYATGEARTIHAMDDVAGWHAMQYFTRCFVPIRGVDGNVRGILNLSKDVTNEVRERNAREASEKRAQAELQRTFALLEEAPVILSVLEYPDWRITMVNRANRELMGDRPLVGERLRDIGGAADSPLVAAIERIYASGRAETHELVTQSQDFAGRSFNTTIVPIKDPGGATGRVMVVAVETTESRRAREALERQARDLELARTEAVDAGRAKDQFLAMLGHELRNPLAPMHTAVQLLVLEGTSSPGLGILERQIQYMTRLVDDLLDISRIARGMVVLHRQNLEIVTIVNRGLELVRPLLDERGHRVVMELEDRDLGVSADPDRLAQVVANLVTNAAKYSEPESQIRIVGKRSGDRVTLSVSDDGIGIAPEMLERVFEAFVQQPQTLDRSIGGLGLGLSIVKSLVEAHGGTVSACSEGPGRGSTFVVHLPAIEVRRAPPGSSSSGRRSPRVTTPQRILVVDDNHEAADILQIALAAVGHTVMIAYSGPAALEIATAQSPHIALVDLGLPVMDGYQLAERLRATHGMPVVAITGYGQESDRQRTRAAGFAAHLVKPVDLHELCDLVSRLCEAPLD